jgi:cytochrome c556
MRFALTCALAAGIALPLFAADAAKEVKDSMKDIKKANKELKKLANAKKFTDPAFTTELDKLIKAGDKLKAYKHPEAEFNKMSAAMSTALAAVKAAVDKKDITEAEKAWKSVGSSCASCHDKYKKD